MSKIMVEGLGLSISFSDSNLEFEVTTLTLPDISYEMIKGTHLGNTSVETFIRSKLAKIGELTFEAHLDLEKMYSATAKNETITISLMPEGATAASTWTARGCISKRATSQITSGDRATMTVTVSFTNTNADGSEAGINLA